MLINHSIASVVQPGTAAEEATGCGRRAVDRGNNLPPPPSAAASTDPISVSIRTIPLRARSRVFVWKISKPQQKESERNSSFSPSLSLILGRRQKMKQCVGSLFTSFGKKKTEKKRKKKQQQLGDPSSIDRSGASFGSNASSSSTSSEEDLSTSSKIRQSPNSVLPPPAAVSVHELFALFDRDRDGKITRRELEAVLRQLGPDPPTAEEVDLMVAEADRDGDGCITLEELSAALGPSATLLSGGGGGSVEEEGGNEAELKEVFAVFDADGDGRISAEEIMGVFLTLGDDCCTLEECRRMIAGVDTDGDGFVCFKDFARMMDGRRFA